MPIESSSYSLGVPQRDGRRYVTELHTDSTGAEHRRDYGPVGDDTDFDAVLAEHAAQLSEQLAADEAAAVIETGDWIEPVHQERAELAQRLRARFVESAGPEKARLAYHLVEWLAGGVFTDEQIRAVFGISEEQYEQARARFVALHDAHAAVVAAGQG